MVNPAEAPNASLKGSDRIGGLLAERYRLERVLGRGGAADVYRATDELLGRPVAVKVFRSSGEDPEADRLRIDAEMRTLAALSDPGLVTLFDAGVATQPDDLPVPFLVMELVSGPTLRQHIDTHGLSTLETAFVGSELAATLAYVHACGVIHRDVKPGNILFGPPRGQGRYSTKLTDFGIARLVGSDPLTAHGSAVGTAHYLSPEQAMGEPVSSPSDIYSLGLVLIECLTGEMAFPGDAIPAAVARLRSDPPVPSRFGAGWESLLSAMTTRDPAHRPCAADVARELDMISRSRATTAAAPIAGVAASATATTAANTVPTLIPGADRTTASRSLRGSWGVAAAATVLLAGVAASVTLLNGTEDAPAPVADTGPKAAHTVPKVQSGSELNLVPTSPADSLVPAGSAVPATSVEPAPAAIVPPAADQPPQPQPAAEEPVPAPANPGQGNGGSPPGLGDGGPPGQSNGQGNGNGRGPR
ncbi:serine/threonine-protein kinase [Hoyosella subflava]|uniref:non-specific serine/threonine protein kinase n=1 Tax=Hoyosella subflava (strain DSM 45089 / JCM 17490 / NBRC 109087 / DQS3-9A1) TaxID=443218 RepID=F6ES24_HOYSD|nr:serine/threonine-protein kinase [Hoyosella subflava]AEF42028.1 putative serine/threonine-protein kinase [Hoyosella subflava DQS3-9A1]